MQCFRTPELRGSFRCITGDPPPVYRGWHAIRDAHLLLHGGSTFTVCTIFIVPEICFVYSRDRSSRYNTSIWLINNQSSNFLTVLYRIGLSQSRFMSSEKTLNYPLNQRKRHQTQYLGGRDFYCFENFIF